MKTPGPTGTVPRLSHSHFFCCYTSLGFSISCSLRLWIRRAYIFVPYIVLAPCIELAIFIIDTMFFWQWIWHQYHVEGLGKNASASIHWNTENNLGRVRFFFFAFWQAPLKPRMRCLLRGSLCAVQIRCFHPVGWCVLLQWHYGGGSYIAVAFSMRCDLVLLFPPSAQGYALKATSWDGKGC